MAHLNTTIRATNQADGGTTLTINTTFTTDQGQVAQWYSAQLVA